MKDFKVKDINLADFGRKEISIAESEIKSEPVSEKARIVLTHRIKSPKIEYVNFEGKALNYTSQKNGNSPILINLWAILKNQIIYLHFYLKITIFT